MFTLLLACAPSDKPATTAAECVLDAPADTPLHADGTLLRDGDDRIASFRGVNAGGRSKFAPYSPFDYGNDFDGALADYLDRAASWGLTGLRVPFTWAALEPVRGQWDTEWLARYDALVDGAAARGMWVVVDFHQDVYGEFYCGDGFPAWTVENAPEPHHDCPDWFFGYLGDPEVDAAFDAFWSDARGTRTAQATMWSALAAHFAGRAGVVGFEPFNEPGWGTANMDTWESTTLTDYYTSIAGTIHAEAPEALVFFDPTGLDATSASTSLGRPDGENLVFAPHFYDPAIIAGADAVSTDPLVQLGKWAAVGDAWQVPVWVGEYGVDPDLSVATTFGDAHYDAFDQYGFGATWWEYSVATETWNGEDLGLVEGDGRENGVLVDVVARPVPRFVAGEDVVVSYAAGTLTLDFNATGAGITEITLPTRVATDTAGWPGAAEAAVVGTGFCFDRRADRVYLRPDAAGPVHVEVGR